MKSVPFLFSLLLGVLLSGCQTTHSLPQPEVDFSRPLPAVHVSVVGDIPDYEIRNDLRRRGTFEQVLEGHSEDGYNLLVKSSSNYMGFHNLPTMFLSAFTLFLVPVPISWDSEAVFVISRGDRRLGAYYVANHTDQYRNLFVGTSGRDEHIQRLVDVFIAQALASPFGRAESQEASVGADNPTP